MKKPNGDRKRLIPSTMQWQHYGLNSREKSVIPRIVIADRVSTRFWRDLYYYALAIRWPFFWVSIAIVFLLLNSAFALLFMLGKSPIANQYPAGFAGAFFFSVETLSTVGYGDMHPQTVYGHLVATLDIFVGMCSIALTTGLIFARFSRPKSRLVFARFPVIATQYAHTTLAVRVANERYDMITDVKAKMWMIYRDVSIDGTIVPRLHELPLELDHYPVLMLYWTIVHAIDESSPLHGKTAEALMAMNIIFMLNVEGFDSTMAQTVSNSHTWSGEDILWQQRYVDSIKEEQGVSYVDGSHFDKTEPL